MARKLDLRTGRPVWMAYRAPAVPVSTLHRDLRCDVVVIGMGISGAMIAEALTRRGHDVVAIDRRGPMRGSTPATTALVQFEIDQPLTKLSRMVGKEKAVAAWRRSRLAVMNLGARIETLGIECRLAMRPSLYLAGNVLDPAGLREEAAARRDAGISAEYLSRAQLKEGFGLARDGAILSEGNLALDPRKLTAGLLNLARKRKARLYAPVEATAIAHSGDEVAISTRDGPVIRAGHAVLATGYELMDPVSARTHSIISTWAIATRPQKQAIWPRASFIWEASDPYLYMRATDDGRIICGGEDEDFQDEEHRDALILEKTAAIMRKLAALMPGIDPSLEFSWTGSFGATPTGLPIIGTLPRKLRIHAVMGYGGNGITFSQLASEMIATTLDGREDSDADLFAMPS